MGAPNMTIKRSSIFDELQQPVNWAYMATALQKASSLMDWTRKRDITDWRYVPIYRMLIGFSLENLLKGILIAEGHEVMKNYKRLNHGLKQYAEKVSGIPITLDERDILARLEPYVKWAGRYPRPKTSDEMVSIGHSKRLHDAELALGQKLYDYLRSRSTEIEPDQFLLPSIE
jgi:hypothetical protein